MWIYIKVSGLLVEGVDSKIEFIMHHRDPYGVAQPSYLMRICNMGFRLFHHHQDQVIMMNVNP